MLAFPLTRLRFPDRRASTVGGPAARIVNDDLGVTRDVPGLHQRASDSQRASALGCRVDPADSGEPLRVRTNSIFARAFSLSTALAERTQDQTVPQRTGNA